MRFAEMNNAYLSEWKHLGMYISSAHGHELHRGIAWRQLCWNLSATGLPSVLL